MKKIIAQSLLILTLALVPLQAVGDPAGKAAVRGATKSAARGLPKVAEAGLGKTVAKGGVRGVPHKVPTYRRPWGPRHSFRKQIRLERYTNRPLTDKTRGLPRHSFWKYPEPGRKGSAIHVQRKLNIPHPIKRREEIIVKRETAYHDRPIKGGHGHAREVILEKPVQGKAIELRERLGP